MTGVGVVKDVTVATFATTAAGRRHTGGCSRTPALLPLPESGACLPHTEGASLRAEGGSSLYEELTEPVLADTA